MSAPPPVVPGVSNASLLDTYEAAAGGDRDEMRSADGSINASWVELIRQLDRLGPGEVGRRDEEIRLLLEQDGVTYNITTDEDRPYRPWRLDALPLMVSADDWQRVGSGVAQRAELANLVLADLFGERRLLAEGLIPASLVFSDPQFFRACDRIGIAGRRNLVTMATDLTRTDSGDWVVLGQRAEAPSGAWYALENRRVLSRVFPNVFRSHHVSRLVPFVRALRAALQSAAPEGIDDPSIVILSPGTLSETAFEHASIAAHMGYPLVEGSDLMTRHGRVWLRTVSDKPVPVDVILRRLDTSFCDPLELRANSTLGVPGLVDAARTGAVSIVNPLGSGLVESAGLAPLWPALCRHLLGEDLVLPSVPAWWCGDRAGRSHVLANLDRLVVRPVSRGSLAHSIDTAGAIGDELAELRRRIEASPEQWVGQERVAPSRSPVFDASPGQSPGGARGPGSGSGGGPFGGRSAGGRSAGLVSRPTLVRTYAVAQANDYLVMDGGLARAAPRRAESDSVIRAASAAGAITTRAGAIAKDIWVLSEQPETEADFWIHEGVQPALLAPALPARAAENLFWVGRYAERAEAAVRLQRTINGRRNEFESAEAGPGPAALVVLLGALSLVTGTHPGFVGHGSTERLENPEAELLSLLIDKHRVGTIAHSVSLMMRAIDELRDQMSIDTWLVIGSLQTQLDEVSVESPEETLNTVLDDLLHGLLSLTGLSSESMVRDHGWHFMNVGRRIERALKLTALLRASLGAERGVAAESVILESVLTACESVITYRRRYRSRARLSTALDLLLSDEDNPRSLAFQVRALTEDLKLLERERPVDQQVKASTMIREVSTTVGGLDSVSLATPDDSGARVRLDHTLEAIGHQLMSASDALTASYFTKQPPQHQYSAVGFTRETGFSGHATSTTPAAGGSKGEIA